MKSPMVASLMISNIVHMPSVPPAPRVHTARPSATLYPCIHYFVETISHAPVHFNSKNRFSFPFTNIPYFIQIG